MNVNLQKEAVLRIGEVSEINGKTVFILVDKNKNASELLFDGSVIKNVSVGAYIEIRKGLISIIGKVEGEKLTKEKIISNNKEYQIIDRNSRYLTVCLSGYIDPKGKFIGGIKELPLIGNEAYLLTEEKIHIIHNLLKEQSSLKINISKTDLEEIPIYLPIDGLFNSHIAIFGNTGSGKSNTLASLYGAMINELSLRINFTENCKFFIFDFNGEYIKPDCITNNKKIYNLSTRQDTENKIPMKFEEFLDLETLSILFEATEKTQRPFLDRALKFYNNVKKKNGDNNVEYNNYFKNILQKRIYSILCMANKDIAFKLLDYIEEILHFFYENPEEENLKEDIDFHNNASSFYLRKQFSKDNADKYFHSLPDEINNTKIYTAAVNLNNKNVYDLKALDQLFLFILLQLISDLLQYKSQIEHITPLIGRFKSKRSSIEKTFDIKDDADIWDNNNVIILNLDKVNLDMKKTIPLLIAKYIYNDHKNYRNTKTLSIIIDEAHNILSKTSFRETENWKDYRLETFEEIIKEGRKFGVFVTIASQRPNDISETIISQAHNYFIHQLINQRDLDMVGNAISYIDKITEEAIPTLPVGTCIFSGIVTPMPIRMTISELPDKEKPDSSTIKFEDITDENIIYL
jgi:DNA helicase HerA-like ATPase